MFHRQEYLNSAARLYYINFHWNWPFYDVHRLLVSGSRTKFITTRKNAAHPAGIYLATVPFFLDKSDFKGVPNRPSEIKFTHNIRDQLFRESWTGMQKRFLYVSFMQNMVRSFVWSWTQCLAVNGPEQFEKVREICENIERTNSMQLRMKSFRWNILSSFTILIFISVTTCVCACRNNFIWDLRSLLSSLFIYTYQSTNLCIVSAKLSVTTKQRICLCTLWCLSVRQQTRPSRPNFTINVTIFSNIVNILLSNLVQFQLNTNVKHFIR